MECTFGLQNIIDGKLIKQVWLRDAVTYVAPDDCSLTAVATLQVLTDANWRTDRIESSATQIQNPSPVVGQPVLQRGAPVNALWYTDSNDNFI